jgi:hypothetical protein
VNDTGEVKLDLQDGFAHDEVVISADGREIARLVDVTTRTQIGLARSFRLPIAGGAMRLTVAVTSLNLAQEIDLPESRPIWIGVSVSEGRDRLMFRVQTERFGYV